MHKRLIILFIFILAFMPVIKVNASNVQDNYTKNEYTIIIEDDADLLTPAEEQKLKKQMAVLTEFGYVMFKTTNTANGTGTPLRYIQNYYYSKLGNKSGVAFYIDMKKREVCACATGGLDKIITSSKCDTIMDNVYRYATRKEYFECAKETFIQMNRVLNGEKIAESMKYYCNGIIAVMISLFISYGFYIMISKNRRASNKELIDECKIYLDHTDIEVRKTGSHSVYSPVESSSGGSSGGGGRRWRRWILRKRRKSRILK